MVQPRIPALRFEGPFLGLNTTHNPRQLGAAFARWTENVIISDGRLRPRAPVDHYARERSDPYVPISLPKDYVVRSLFAWKNPLGFGDDSQFVLVKSVAPSGEGALHVFRPDGSVQVGFGLCDRPASFVVIEPYCCVLDGSEKLLKTDGTPERSFTLGLVAPTNQMTAALLTEPNGAINATVEYAVTWGRYLDRVESNPKLFGPFTAHPGKGVKFTFKGPVLPDSGIDRWRIYRKNISLGQVAYRLLYELSPISPGQEFWDILEESQINQSSAETGPFAPSRNGVPTQATMGAWYKGRLFFNDIRCEQRHKVRYSAFNRPDHVYKDDYVVCTGDGTECISGLASYGDQLFIGEESAIHALSGVIQGPTNLTVATGAIPPVSYHTLSRTRCRVGPVASAVGGNGLFVAGEPGYIHFAALTGFYRFDGIAERQLSDLIAPTYQSFLHLAGSDKYGAISFADDRLNKLLYLLMTPITSTHESLGLIYHYGLDRGDGIGGWGTFRLRDKELPGESCQALASSVGMPRRAGASIEYRTASFIGGTNKGHVLIARDEPTDRPWPQYWKWKTGRLPIIEGKRAHVYGIEWFLSQSGTTPGGSPLVFLGFCLNDETEDHLRRIDIGQLAGFDQQVGATVQDITLIVQGVEGVEGWSPELGILGFSIDAEVCGKR